MKTINKLKTLKSPIKKIFLEILTLLCSALFLSKKFLIKLNFYSILVILWLIILFSFDQIKGQKKITKNFSFLAYSIAGILIFIDILKGNLYISALTLITTVLVTVKTPKNEQLNKAASKIGLSIFGLSELVYSMIGFLSIPIIEKVAIVFVASCLFNSFLVKRKFVNYVGLILLGILSSLIFKYTYIFLVLQILVPLVPRDKKIKKFYALAEPLYVLISFLVI